MNRYLYLFLLLTPFILAGALFKDFPKNPPYALTILVVFMFQ